MLVLPKEVTKRLQLSDLENQLLDRARYFIFRNPDDPKSGKINYFISRLGNSTHKRKDTQETSLKNIALELGDPITALEIIRGRRNSDHGKIARKQGYDRYALECTEKFFNDFSAGDRIHYAGVIADIRRDHMKLRESLQRELEKLVSKPFRIDEVSDDPLVLLRPFFKRYRQLLVGSEIKTDFDTPTKEDNSVSRSITYRHNFDGETRELYIDITKRGEHIKEHDMYDIDLAKTDFISIPNLDECDLFIRCRKLKEKDSEKSFDDGFDTYLGITKNNNGYNMWFQIGNKDVPVTNDEPRLLIDHILQKFLTGTYDETKPIIRRTAKRQSIKGLETVAERSATEETDPLLFIWKTGKQLGIDFKDGTDIKPEVKKHKVGDMEYPSFMVLSFEKGDPKDHKSLHLELFFKDPSVKDGYLGDPKNMPKELAPLIAEYSFERAFKQGFGYFGEFQKYMGAWFSYNRFRQFRYEAQAFFDIVPDFSSNGEFIFTELNLNNMDTVQVYDQDRVEQEVVRKAFDDISSATKTDFRPYVHRALELYAGIPQEDWHDPRIYLGVDKQIDKISDLTIATLFSGEERVQMQRQLADARLSMRNGYASVPRLSLGPIRLPTPGMKDIEKSEFVIDAAPLLVEYLHTLGVMTPIEAEEVVARKLTHYLVHNGDFQLSRKRAVEVLGSLGRK